MRWTPPQTGTDQSGWNLLPSKRLLLDKYVQIFRHRITRETERLTDTKKTIYFFCLGIAPRAQEERPATCTKSVTLNRCCYPHTGNGGHRWCLRSSLSVLEGLSIQDEAMGVAWSEPRGGSLPRGRYLFAPLTGNKEENKSLIVLRVKPTPTWFPINSLYTSMDNTLLHSLSNVCHPWD